MAGSKKARGGKSVSKKTSSGGKGKGKTAGGKMKTKTATKTKTKGRGKTSSRRGVRRPQPVGSTTATTYDNEEESEYDTGPRAFSSGLCDCFTDCSGCCYVFWCGSCALMTNRAVAEERKVDTDDFAWGSALGAFAYASGCGFWALVCLACEDRKAAMHKYDLGPFDFWQSLISVFCAPCSVCQVQREHYSRQGSHADRTSCFCCKSAYGL